MFTKERYEKLILQLVPNLDVLPTHIRAEILERWWRIHEYSLQTLPRIYIDKNLYIVGTYSDCIYEPYLPKTLRAMILSFLVQDMNQPGINMMVASYQPNLTLENIPLRNTCLKVYETQICGAIRKSYEDKHFPVYLCGVVSDQEMIEGVPTNRQQYFMDYNLPNHDPTIHRAIWHYLETGTQPLAGLGVIFHTTIPSGGFLMKNYVEDRQVFYEFYKNNQRRRDARNEEFPPYRTTDYAERDFYMELRTTGIEPLCYHEVPIEILCRMPDELTQKLRTLHHATHFTLAVENDNPKEFKIRFRGGGYIWFQVNQLCKSPTPKTYNGMDSVIGPRRRVIPFAISTPGYGNLMEFYTGLVKYDKRTWYFEQVQFKCASCWGFPLHNGNMVRRIWLRQVQVVIDEKVVFPAPKFRVSKNSGEVLIETLYYNYFA
jgi:hypothetical protein